MREALEEIALLVMRQQNILEPVTQETIDITMEEAMWKPPSPRRRNRHDHPVHPRQAREHEPPDGVAGASGSGKTNIAMELAAGICGDEPFAVQDTEARRGLHYADDYNFEHVDFGPPFTPDRYLESIRALAKRGFRAVVVDSMSHEWEGEGGVLEMADKDNAKSPSNWIKPKAAHKRLVNGLLQVGTNLIFCLRAQEKVEVVPDPDRGGKMMVRPIGWQPISEKRFLFEMTASFTLRPDAPGVVDLSLPHKLQDQHRMAFPPGQHISHEAGVLLGAWARGDAIETPDKELWDGGRRKANEGGPR